MFSAGELGAAKGSKVVNASAAATANAVDVIMFISVFEKRGFEYMFRVATSCEARASHLLRAAQFNIGRAYFQGSGVRRSVAEAERLY